MGAGITAIGATVLATGKQALAAYATWEQAVGGVDTLFKDASGTVQKYASEAYKTAGIGANDYMNQVTSFAASLVSSLGGDTAKAAEMGNQAIIDMSDNANKMGTDIGSIQQTYQSLARGNYAMLDNLKLGYGGTKSEMERLISDANKLPGVLKDGNDLSIDSFSDVVEAISRVQKEMGISGTTAREAATTIEGSVDSMKAAWQNWLAGLGNSNADMGALSQQLAESIAAALKNILPRVGQIAKGVVKAIPALFSDLVTLLPKPFQNAINAIGSVFNGLGDMFKPVRNAIAPLIASFVALGAGGIAPLLSKIPLLGGVLGGLSGPLAALGGPIGIAVAAIGALIATTPKLRDAFGEQASALFTRFKAEIASIQPAFDALVKSIQGMLKQIMPVITDAIGQLIPVVGSIIQTMLPLIPTIIEPLINGTHRPHAGNQPDRDEPAAAIDGRHSGIAAIGRADHQHDHADIRTGARRPHARHPADRGLHRPDGSRHRPGNPAADPGNPTGRGRHSRAAPATHAGDTGHRLGGGNRGIRDHRIHHWLAAAGGAGDAPIRVRRDQWNQRRHPGRRRRSLRRHQHGHLTDQRRLARRMERVQEHPLQRGKRHRQRTARRHQRHQRRVRRSRHSASQRRQGHRPRPYRRHHRHDQQSRAAPSKASWIPSARSSRTRQPSEAPSREADGRRTAAAPSSKASSKAWTRQAQKQPNPSAA